MSPEMDSGPKGLNQGDWDSYAKAMRRARLAKLGYSDIESPTTADDVIVVSFGRGHGNPNRLLARLIRENRVAVYGEPPESLTERPLDPLEED